LTLHVSYAAIPVPTGSTPEQRHALQTFSFLNKGWVFNARDEIAALFQAQLCVSTSVTVRNSGFTTQCVFRIIRTDMNDGPFLWGQAVFSV